MVSSQALPQSFQDNIEPTLITDWVGGCWKQRQASAVTCFRKLTGGTTGDSTARVKLLVWGNKFGFLRGG
jgi:hypothetical protein